MRVRYGHRRALAAVQAGRETVPVVVYTGALTDATAAEIDRILGQHAENTHRTGLTDRGDRRRVRGVGRAGTVGLNRNPRGSPTRRAARDEQTLSNFHARKAGAVSGQVIPMPYPHAHKDCDVCGQHDADMQATYPGVGERPARWCSRCAGDQLAGLVIVLATVTVFPLERQGQFP